MHTVEELEARLREAEALLNAIRNGEVDAPAALLFTNEHEFVRFREPERTDRPILR
ncbi:MAG TPA: hypothetical protein VGD94_15730 [Vicinamibacterales bacterium]